MSSDNLLKGKGDILLFCYCSLASRPAFTLTWCFAKNRRSFHRRDLLHVLKRGNARQDLSREDDDHAPHVPGIHAATPRTPTNQSKKVECPLFSAFLCERLRLIHERSGSSISRMAELSDLPCWSRAMVLVTPPLRAPCITKLSAPTLGRV